METDRIADLWGTRTPVEQGGQWPIRVDQMLAEGVEPGRVERWVRSACVMCSNDCGLDIAVTDGRIVGVRGLASDRVNHGRLGPKGLFSWQANHAPDRLLRPLVRDNGVLCEASYEEALTRIIERSKTLLQEKGPLSHAFYTSGQLMLEEYYTLAVIGKAGIGTPHMDGNTRLCTATAASALKQSFGCDGQPGSYTDIEHTDALFLYGHNIPETQTVLWARMLDRLHGSDRPALVCVDPRLTPAAREADVHLAVRPGTNLALMNGLVREVMERGWVDKDYVEAHTVGLRGLEDTVAPYNPQLVEEICGVDAGQVIRAAEIFGTSPRVLSTVLQGFYQSHQATASACAVNNLHLLRGMIGKPGAGILQMNGQPTAQNNRECGADGDLPGFRNWANPEHVHQLADLWDVDSLVIPHWAPPTHAMQIFRYVEQGSIEFLWVAGTNPAVSMPESARIRRILAQESLFLVVNDPFLTETALLADVVLPAAMWGEKTGTFTNADRTVHLAMQAVEPPGDARSDLQIWIDYARGMGFTDRSGRSIPRWDATPEAAFAAWKDATVGRPLDYTGLTYERLSEGSGIQWPCNQENPQGTERLYTDGRFPTDAQEAETYGEDLLTGAATPVEQYRATDPAGRAFLRFAPYTPAHEMPSEEFPLLGITGRTVYQFHTRTKTRRAPQLDRAAPRPWVELSVVDASELGVAEGDEVDVTSPRGWVRVPARISSGRPGVVFIPFHYGYFDALSTGPQDAAPTAANELTMSVWDPVSKQPAFKSMAVRVTRVGPGSGPAPAPTTGASAPAAPTTTPTTGGPAATTYSVVT